MTIKDIPLLPAPLTPGARIAIVTPATVVRREYVERGAESIRRHGYEPVVMPGVRYGDDGSFAGTPRERLDDLMRAFADPSVGAVWCARGGYGSVQLIGRIPPSLPRANPKWLVGFSDVCALHSMMLRAGVASLHAPMLRRLRAPGDWITDSCFDILAGGAPSTVEAPWHPLATEGRAEGLLLGGNMSVLGDLAGTPFDPFADVRRPFILLLEDVGESLSRLERRLWRLRLAGVLNRAAGIIFGQFSACAPTVNHAEVPLMASALLREWRVECPVAFDFPAGHDECNVPLVVGAPATLETGPAYTLLTQRFNQR